MTVLTARPRPAVPPALTCVPTALLTPTRMICLADGWHSVAAVLTLDDGITRVLDGSARTHLLAADSMVGVR